MGRIPFSGGRPAAYPVHRVRLASHPVTMDSEKEQKSMKYNLTDSQKELLRWLVQQIRDSRLAEEFYVLWAQQRGEICDFPGDHPEITRGMLDALADAGLILCDANLAMSH